MKLIALLQDKEKMTRMRINARRTANEKFSWQIIGKRVNDIYKMALNGSI
jgi:glycosyltransferase involved in cell wall biosynthesis